MLIRSAKLLCAFLLLIVAWLLAFGNHQSTVLSFMAWQTPALPLFVWLLATLFVGVLIGLILGRLVGRKRTGR
ncbi:lipopolysaccharide assembly protein LapA domain-containing protein [Saccharospirillum mangrovi]|uniref:lipopolysaccharide assembly protein LapA domain-containing protein n=1 Tax=Saccharospirillum mangrovi TaxID=2161747 RepID=UPI000D3D4E65|nr:lipopolysaccharide assembly protein LapA domain-containing protein [Saccharospirillum mangrovi]